MSIHATLLQRMYQITKKHSGEKKEHTSTDESLQPGSARTLDKSLVLPEPHEGAGLDIFHLCTEVQDSRAVRLP